MIMNERFHGFKVTGIRPCAEVSGTAVEWVHEKTGAEVFWLDNGDQNKLFAITFTTLPQDDSGVFHMIEHSVLCGSEKYPVKEPFVELLKSSMQTFQNAMTYPDKTVYPVASRNEQDFMNLVSVYLDAVFAPRMVTEENVFCQEGWHLEETEGKLTCKGVVYNEMKGAMSEEGSLISRKLNSLLYPDTSYGFNSGGSPEAIRRLSYQQFVETYRRYYHPSNARVYLDGSVPVEKTLKLLGEYFDRYEKLETLPVIAAQQPVKREAVQYYDFPQGEDTANKGRLTLGKIIGRWDERVKKNAARLVGHLLTDTNDSPLKKALLDRGLAKNITISVQTATYQPYVNIHLKDLKDGAREEAVACIRQTLEGVLDKGLDEEDLLAEIDRMEFNLREPDEPQGLYRCIQALSGWLYGGDPLDCICVDETLAQLRRLAATDYF
ncbi:MAG: insulinase family protein, partial [Clostridia bacterium]|nr:insulinase family protein [Clostridia bacterium]